jgi:formate-dependent nitrite reductase membrane component NrfD
VSNVFNMELRAQQEWSWLLALWLFFGGSGGGLFLLFMAFDLAPLYAVLSLAFIMVGGVILLLELGNPLRVWRTIFRPSTSWLSRGVIFVLLFAVSSVLSVGPRIEMLSWLLPFTNSVSVQFFGWVASLCALMIILYPAFFVRSTSRAIPFWSSPVLPLLFVGYAVIGGAGVVLLLTPYSKAPTQVVSLSIILIAINAVMMAIYLVTMYRSGGSAKESVQLLSRGTLGSIFWIGIVGAGMVLPVAGALINQSTVSASGGLILLGGLLFRYALLKAGVYVAPALVEADFDLSKLNRTHAEFAREYVGMGAQRTSRSG